MSTDQGPSNPPGAEVDTSVTGKYDHLSRESLIALLERHERERARIGLNWAGDKADRDRALNDDFVVLRSCQNSATAPRPGITS
jgi:hypothetical protein